MATDEKSSKLAKCYLYPLVRSTASNRSAITSRLGYFFTAQRVARALRSLMLKHETLYKKLAHYYAGSFPYYCPIISP